MNIASAYPNSDLSVLSMTLIAVVMVCTLAAWLILVFLADRHPRSPARRGQAGMDAATTPPPAVADNDHSELDERHAAEHEHGVAA